MQVLPEKRIRCCSCGGVVLYDPSYSDFYLDSPHSGLSAHDRRTLTSTGTSHDYLYLIRSVTYFQDENVSSLIQLLTGNFELFSIVITISCNRTLQLQGFFHFMETPRERKKVFITSINIQLPWVCQTLSSRGTVWWKCEIVWKPHDCTCCLPLPLSLLRADHSDLTDRCVMYRRIFSKWRGHVASPFLYCLGDLKQLLEFVQGK